MSSKFALDPVSGIPDPPDDDSMIFEWARELTRSLQKDHISNVDRTETIVMSANGLDTRPTESGSRRFFFDEKTGTLYLDSENKSGLEEWVKINNKTSWALEGTGVHVIYSSSLPYSAGTSGTFSFDEEVYDKNDYWTSGSPTDIDFSTSRKYQILFVATIDNLATGKELLISIDIDGTSSEMIVGEFASTISSGAGEEYELRMSFLKDITDVNTLKFVWASAATYDLQECYAIVTPVAQSDISIATPDETGISDHGLLSGLGDDDHSLYLLASDATNRATFASYWTDLTDSGETSLHTHDIDVSPLYLDNNDPIYWRNKDNGGWIEVIVVNNFDNLFIGNATDIVNLTIQANEDINVTAHTGDITWAASDGAVQITAAGTGKNLTLNAYNNKIDLNCSIIDASGGGRLRLPYLGAIPASPVNGDIWMESDGLHLYYGGAEKIVAGV